jgi:hypothetical protein
MYAIITLDIIRTKYEHIMNKMILKQARILLKQTVGQLIKQVNSYLAFSAIVILRVTQRAKS